MIWVKGTCSRTSQPGRDSTAESSVPLYFVAPRSMPLYVSDEWFARSGPCREQGGGQDNQVKSSSRKSRAALVGNRLTLREISGRLEHSKKQSNVVAQLGDQIKAE